MSDAGIFECWDDGDVCASPDQEIGKEPMPDPNIVAMVATCE